MVDLGHMGQKGFLILGRAGMDIYPDPSGTKTEEATQFFACLGGSSANIGVALSRLGHKTELVTSVSDDSIGRFCLNELDKYGVGRQHVKSVRGEMRTSLAVVESRVEDHQSVIYRNNAADFQMVEDDVLHLDYQAYGALILTGTVLASEPSRSSCLKAIDLAKTAGLPIIMDIDYRPYSWVSDREAASIYSKAASLCDIVIGNDDEFGVMANDYAKGQDFANKLADSGAAIVVYKMGEKGSITFQSDGSQFETGIFEVVPLKPTGAGDSFMGALLASLAAGLPIKESVRRGSAAAALVVTRVGCAPAMPTHDELNTFMREHSGLS